MNGITLQAARIAANQCQKCGKDVTDGMHTCPYAEEIGGDSESLCNCCGECSYQCAMDI